MSTTPGEEGDDGAAMRGKVALLCGQAIVRRLDQMVIRRLAKQGARIALNFPNDVAGAKEAVEKFVRREGCVGRTFNQEYWREGQAQMLLGEVSRELGRLDAIYVFITSTNVEHKEAIMESIAMPLGIGRHIEDKQTFIREINALKARSTAQSVSEEVQGHLEMCAEFILKVSFATEGDLGGTTTATDASSGGVSKGHFITIIRPPSTGALRRWFTPSRSSGGSAGGSGVSGAECGKQFLSHAIAMLQLPAVQRKHRDFVVSGDKNTWADVSVQLTNKDPKALERSPSLRNHASAATSTSNTSPASATATATSGSSSASPTSPSSATRMLAAGGTSSSKASDTNQAAIAHRARQVAEKSLQALSIQSGGSGGTSPSYTLSGGADGRRASSRRNDSADCLIVVDVNSPSYAMTGEDPFAASVAFDEVHVQELQASSAAGTTPRHEQGSSGRSPPSSAFISAQQQQQPPQQPVQPLDRPPLAPVAASQPQKQQQQLREQEEHALRERLDQRIVQWFREEGGRDNLIPDAKADAFIRRMADGNDDVVDELWTAVFKALPPPTEAMVAARDGRGGRVTLQQFCAAVWLCGVTRLGIPPSLLALEDLAEGRIELRAVASVLLGNLNPEDYKTLHKLQKYETTVIDYDELTIGPNIAKGQYGQVKRGHWRGHDVAIKEFNLQALSPVTRQEFLQEVKVLSKICHPYCLQLYGASLEPLAIITELLTPQNLQKMLDEQFGKPLAWSWRLRAALQVSQGLAYLHDACKIVHSDVKTPNILLAFDGTIKLADFGYSTIKTEIASSTMNGRNDLVGGTPDFMAPELLRIFTSDRRNTGRPSALTDMYSCGVVFWHILNPGHRPYRAKLKQYPKEAQYAALAGMVIAGDRPEMDHLSANSALAVPPGYIKLMDACMADDPRDRPRAEECAAMLLCVVDGQGEAEARQQAGYRRVEELHASMLGRKQQQQQRQQQQQQQQQQHQPYDHQPRLRVAYEPYPAPPNAALLLVDATNNNSNHANDGSGNAGQRYHYSGRSVVTANGSSADVNAHDNGDDASSARGAGDGALEAGYLTSGTVRNMYRKRKKAVRATEKNRRARIWKAIYLLVACVYVFWVVRLYQQASGIINSELREHDAAMRVFTRQRHEGSSRLPHHAKHEEPELHQQTHGEAATTTKGAAPSGSTANNNNQAKHVSEREASLLSLRDSLKHSIHQLNGSAAPPPQSPPPPPPPSEVVTRGIDLLAPSRRAAAEAAAAATAGAKAMGDDYGSYGEAGSGSDNSDGDTADQVMEDEEVRAVMQALGFAAPAKADAAQQQQQLTELRDAISEHVATGREDAGTAKDDSKGSRTSTGNYDEEERAWREALDGSLARAGELGSFFPRRESSSQQFEVAVAMLLSSRNFEQWANWMQAAEDIDEHGERIVPPQRLAIVIFDVGLSDYHRSLLVTGTQSEFRARKQSVVYLKQRRDLFAGLREHGLLTEEEMQVLLSSGEQRVLSEDLLMQVLPVLALLAVYEDEELRSAGVTAAVYLDTCSLLQGDPAEDLRELFAARGVAASVDDSAAFVDTALDHTRAVAAAAPPWLVAAFDHAAASTTSSSQTAVQTSSHLLDKPLLDSRMVGLAHLDSSEAFQDFVEVALLHPLRTFCAAKLHKMITRHLARDGSSSSSSSDDKALANAARGHRTVLAFLSMLLYSHQRNVAVTQVDHPSLSTCSAAHNVSNLFQLSRHDMWGNPVALNSNRQAVNLTSTLHEAELEFLKAHRVLTFVLPIKGDQETFTTTLELVNTIGAKERGTRRGNVASLGSYARAARVAVYDLGLSRTQFAMLAGGFADTLGDNALVVPFSFEGLPSHVDHAQDTQGTQAWKLAILDDAIQRFGGMLLWLEPYDAQQRKVVIKRPLDRVREGLMRHGFVSPHTAGKIGERVHPAMLERFGVQGDQQVLESANLDIHVVGIDAENATIMERVHKPLLQCAYDLACIAPQGATKKSHQFTQSAMSVLVRKLGVQGLPVRKNDLHIDAIH